MVKFRYQLFRAKRRDGKLYPKWRIRYFRDGKAVHAETGYTDKGRTEERAKEHLRELEHEAHLAAVGVPVAKKKPLPELVTMWLTEMAASGGKQQMPAAPQHVENMRTKVAWWIKALKLTTPGDVNRAEVVSKALALPVSKGTQEVYIQALKTFLGWCVRNQFLAFNPLSGHRKQAEAPTFKRRALTVEEALRLLAFTPGRRSLVYKGALLTGMRRGELDALTVGDVDWAAGKISLKAQFAKNRKAAEFYLPAAYLDELFAFSAGKRMADSLYEGISQSQSAKTLQRDLKRAGIPYETADGRIDFHSLRVTFLTWVNELGEDVKTVQELGRHADPRMTFGIYTKAREARLRDVVTRAGSRLLETFSDIPGHAGSHAGVTQALLGAPTPDFIGSNGGARVSRHAGDDNRDILGHPRTSSDINQAKAHARHLFESATSSDIAGHSETQELSRRRHALLSQVTEALSGLSVDHLETLAQAIASLGRERGVA